MIYVYQYYFTITDYQYFIEGSDSTSLIKVSDSTHFIKVSEKESKSKTQLETPPEMKPNEKGTNPNSWDEIEAGLNHNFKELSPNQNVFLDKKAFQNPLFFYRVEGLLVSDFFLFL